MFAGIFSVRQKKGDPLVIFAWSVHIENCELDLVDREGHGGKVSINNTRKFKAGRMEMFPEDKHDSAFVW